MQHFRDAGLQPRAFSRGENHDNEVVAGHGWQPILRERRAFRNEGMQERGRMPNQWRGREKGRLRRRRFRPGQLRRW
jgi:hypothetical protein